MSFLDRWLASAVKSPEPADNDDSIIDEAAQIIVRNGLQVPAVMFLEVNRPISFLLSQGTYFLSPIVGIFTSMEKMNRLAAMLDSADGYDKLIERIEDLSRQQKQTEIKDPKNGQNTP